MTTSAIKYLRRVCQIKSDTIYGRQVRRVSIYFTWLAIKLGWSANMVTLASIAVGINSAIWLSVNPLLGVIGLQFMHLLDYVDGEVARYNKTSTIGGLFFDRIAMFIVCPFVFLCVGEYLGEPRLGTYTGFVYLLYQLAPALRRSVHFDISQVPKGYFSQAPTPPRAYHQSALRIVTTSAGAMNILTLMVLFKLSLTIFLVFYAFLFTYLTMRAIWKNVKS